MANAHAIAASGLEAVPGDRCVSWLPLYHDMGLVGFMLTPLLCQLSVDFLATRDFARRPLVWLSLLSEHGGSLSYSPTFGYDLCARRADGGTHGFDLRRWRAAGIGGDMIEPRVPRRFAEVFAPYGFRADAFVPSYGMAEATLAVSFSPLGQGLVVDTIDRRALAEDHVAVPAGPDADAGSARGFVVCGPALPGHVIEIRSDDGKVLPERRLGRIFVRGPSIAKGYFGEPEASAEVFRGRLARYRRSRLPGRWRARHHRAQQGPDHRARPQCLAAGPRMGDRAAAGAAARRCRRLLGRRRPRRRGRRERRAAGAVPPDRPGRARPIGARRQGGRAADRGDRGQGRAGAAARPAADLVRQAQPLARQAELPCRRLRRRPVVGSGDAAREGRRHGRTDGAADGRGHRRHRLHRPACRPPASRRWLAGAHSRPGVRSTPRRWTVSRSCAATSTISASLRAPAGRR